MRSFIKCFQNFIFQEKLFKRGDKIVIGISGGSDSTCLTRILSELKDKYNLKLILAHVNYGLRGRESNEDEQFVKQLAKELELPLEIKYYENKKEKKGNLEEKMRDFRYQFFEKIRRKEKFNWVAVGHTLDDQVETFFMNLLRGTGLKGLGAISVKRDQIIRPLLIFEKKEILEWLENIKVKYRIDKSNLDKKLFRNQIRLELIPLLEKKYNTQIKRRVASLAKQASESSELVDSLISKKYRNVAEQKKDKITFKVKKLVGLKDIILGGIFREAIKELKGDSKNINQAHFLEFRKIIKSKKTKEQKMKFGKLRVEKKGNEIQIKIK
jgi:tRNA(Ile)-lysidine synthase